MYATNKAYDEAILFSHRPVTTVDWCQGRTDEWKPLRWFDGSVTSDSTATCRWSSELTLPDIPDNFDNLGCRLRIRRGLHIPRVGDYLIPWGIYRVNEIGENLKRQVTVSATSFEKQIEDARFPRARRIGGSRPNSDVTAAIVPGNTFRDVIVALVTEAVPDVSFDFRTTAVDRPVTSFIEEKERWSLLDGGDRDTSIAAALGVEMYFDGSGVFVVRDIPTLFDDVVWDTDDVKYPVVTDQSKNQTRASLYNLVVASGQTTTGKPPVGPGFAWDNNPTSRTYAGPDPVNQPELAGDFGVVPMFMVSGFLTQQWQCNNAAATQLKSSLGIQRTMSFSAGANYALETGDVSRRDGSRYLIKSWTGSLTKNSMDMDTNATKADLSDISIGEAT